MRLTNVVRLVMLLTLLFCMGSSTKIVSYKGVLDRIEGDQAIILLEATNQTVAVSKKSLPNGSQVNMWFDIELVDQTYKVISINDELTNDHEKKSTHLMNKLREIKGGLR